VIVHLSSAGGVAVSVPFGGLGITFHAADFDADGLADLVSYREVNGLWVCMLSRPGYATVQVTWSGAATSR